MTDIASSGCHGAHPRCLGSVAPDASERPASAAFFGVAALLFAASVTATIACSASMAAMGGLPMSGGWMLSLMWTRTCGESWLGAAAAFLAMWSAMMLAMMLPALIPVLWRYRRAFGRTAADAANRLTALVGAGYFAVWVLLGAAIFPLGAALAVIELQQPILSRAAPLAAGAVVLIAGAIQFTAWKSDHLACFRDAPGHSLPADAAAALRHGLRLGLHCSACSAGLTAILLVSGMMDLRVMAVVTAAITLERLAPAGEATARLIGAVACTAGFLSIAHAAGLG
jgi:predicted metal-binding membrane protein